MGMCLSVDVVALILTYFILYTEFKIRFCFNWAISVNITWSAVLRPVHSERLRHRHRNVPITVPVKKIKGATC